MGTLLAFPLASPLGGVLVSNIRTEPWGADTWLIEWAPISVTWDASYMISIDGKHYAVAHGQTSIVVQGERGAAPIVQVAQLGGVYTDPARFVSGYFATLINNKIKVTWNPPASITDVEEYHVYWDNKTGTVDFTSALAVIGEDGSASYEFITDALASGTYKFVVRTVDTSGNETTNTTETSQMLTTYPNLVTSEAVVVIAGPKVTITWADPADIGAGSVRIFHNSGNASNLFPDYSTVQATIAAGTQTWTSGNLADGIWVFGLRVFDATNEEPNTTVVLVVRLESAAEVSGYPAKPLLVTQNAAAGKVDLLAIVQPITRSGRATQVKFFTNDGAGGNVDYATALGAGFIALHERGSVYLATLTSAAYGETARKFGCRAYTAGSVVSVNADEITITPDSTAPGVPLSVTAAVVRD